MSSVSPHAISSFRRVLRHPDHDVKLIIFKQLERDIEMKNSLIGVVLFILMCIPVNAQVIPSADPINAPPFCVIYDDVESELKKSGYDLKMLSKIDGSHTSQIWVNDQKWINLGIQKGNESTVACRIQTGQGIIFFEEESAPESKDKSDEIAE